MGLAADLLEQAGHLAAYQNPDPSQAALRRAISTAYYSPFHLLVQDAATRWEGSKEALTGLERAFNHRQMRSVSAQFASPDWNDWEGKVQVVPFELRRVARSLRELQDERHVADYDNSEVWTTVDVQLLLEIPATSFQDWEAIKTHPMAGNYLLAMLLGKPR